MLKCLLFHRRTQLSHIALPQEKNIIGRRMRHGAFEIPMQVSAKVLSKKTTLDKINCLCVSAVHNVESRL